MFLRLAAAGLISLSMAGSAAEAQECHGDPGALGTSRVISLDTPKPRRLGSMQFEDTLPLEDHEVVLTFDDGPSALYTPRVLDALAAQCVKATFFIVGSMANLAPGLVQRIHAEGHTIGTHTQHHASMTRLPGEAAKKEIADGIASVAAAVGDPKAVAPFFRFPYLQENPAVEQYALAQGLTIWSADFTANDWTLITPDQVSRLTVARLERSHKGMILFHDIHQRTALALPAFLQELKKRGYHVVHIVPAHGDYAKIPTKAEQWATRLEASAGTSASWAAWGSPWLVQVINSPLPAAKAEQWATRLEEPIGTSARWAGWARPWLVQAINSSLPAAKAAHAAAPKLSTVPSLEPNAKKYLGPWKIAGLPSG